ncbi:hypothetical protein NPIL_21681 [Nephila pilipes]|uniref:Uncharacterized protein n=1 Tax=Nephila pilipes TaxID=299642 RepID=A0A8X6QYU7_NEPPI|nr:hypothetical protein NPIL_21681 [Nephila pilipes]
MRMENTIIKSELQRHWFFLTDEKRSEKERLSYTFQVVGLFFIFRRSTRLVGFSKLFPAWIFSNSNDRHCHSLQLNFECLIVKTLSREIILLTHLKYEPFKALLITIATVRLLKTKQWESHVSR